MIYVILGVFLAGLGIGSGITYKIEHAAVKSLETAIDSGNVKAGMLLKTIQTQNDQAKAETIAKNQEVDDARRDYIKTVNALDHQLDDFELLDTTPDKSCPDPVSKAADPGVSKREADFAAYAIMVNREIKAKAIACDLAADFADSCWKKFVDGNIEVKK